MQESNNPDAFDRLRLIEPHFIERDSIARAA